MEKIILTGNCYWCTEALYQEIKGCAVVPGYYDISRSPYAFNAKDRLEAVALSFEENEISFRDILEVFFISHNPTLVSWVKADCISPLNRSSVIVESEDLASKARSYIDSQRALYTDPVHTKVLVEPEFFFTPAPTKEHNYYLQNPQDAYSRSIIEPKLLKLKDKAQHLLRSK